MFLKVDILHKFDAGVWQQFDSLSKDYGDPKYSEGDALSAVGRGSNDW